MCRLLLPSEAAEVFLGPIEDRRCRSPPTINQIEQKGTGWGDQPAFSMGILCRLFDGFLYSCPALGEQVLQIQLESVDPPPEDDIAFLPFLEATGWRGWLDYFVGS